MRQIKTKLKRIVLLLTLTTAAMACNSTPKAMNFKYKIVGNTDYIPDNTIIILYNGVFYGEQPNDDQTIATMTVHNGSFGYEGTAKQPAAAVMYIPSESAYMPVFIEKGDIQVFFAKDPINTTVFGTPLNDSIQMLALKNIECSYKAQREMQKFQNPPTADEQKIIQEISIRFRQEVGNIHYSCALRNINNELGFFLVISSQKYFTLEQLANLLVKLPKQKHDHPIIRELDNLVIENLQK